MSESFEPFVAGMLDAAGRWQRMRATQRDGSTVVQETAAAYAGQVDRYLVAARQELGVGCAPGRAGPSPR